MLNKIRKKDGSIVDFDSTKIINAITKSANRVHTKLTHDNEKDIIKFVVNKIISAPIVDINKLHNIVENALDLVSQSVAKSYREYRNYKIDMSNTKDIIMDQIEEILKGDCKENSNSNFAYISTQRTEVAQTFCKEYYQKMYLGQEELRAMKIGYIYVHDLKDMMLPMYNCCLAKIGTILEGGYELDGLYYPEPKDIRRAVSRASDLILNISAQQFGK